MQGKDYNMKNKRVKIRLSVLVFAITTFIIAIANPAIALNSQQYGIDSSFLAELQSKEIPDYDRPEAIEKGLVVENGHVARLYKKESDLRTVIFANKDGTETAYIFDEPVKYIDENGKIVDKSNRLYSVYADEYAYVNKDNDIRTYFPKTLDEKSGIKLEYGDISIEMYPYSGKSTSVEKRTESDEKDYVYYDGVFGNDTSVRYTPTFSGFKEDIILYKNTGNHFNFIIKCGALKMIEENNIVHFIDPQSGEIVATLGEVYMYDSFVGESKDFSHGTWDVATELKHLENGDYLATIIVDEEFLSRPETVYPVYVDPTVTINATGSGSSKTILDTPIYNGSDVTNITAGANTSAVIGYVGTLNGVQYGSGRLLMRFPGLMNQSFMSDYNYTITAATLYMKEASGLSTSASIAAHMYTGPDWNESTTYSSSIWNGVYKRNGSEQPLSSYSFSYPNSTNGSFNITWAVKLWQSNPSMGTKGIMLKNETSESNGTYYKSLYTSEGSTKPYLSVTYAARTAASGAYLSYGLTTRTVTIRLVGTTTTNSTWSPIITASRNAWNNSGAGTNITTTTSGSSSHTLTVDAYPTQTWYGLMTPTVSGSTLTASTIQINTSTVGSTTEFRRSTVTHEMGHLFWLNDNPTTTDPCLMRHDRDREIVYVPQKIDIYHVQNQY
jgi:hypothetical protein